tara:strand:- start:2360 stop:3217 length:858 start_codon:yes stop_codon:yes gene_type:complete
MGKVFLKSPAKINLSLKIGKKINKKYHNIQSIIFLTNLHDQVSIKKIKGRKDRIKFTGKFKKAVNIKNNSITKAMYFLRKKKIINKNLKYEIQIKKNIPVFSGLGGGSSNAATIIKYFYKNKKIKNNEISYFAKYLGSDFRIFFNGNKVIQESFFKIKNFKFNHNFYLLIVYPFKKSSTKEIYRKFKKYEKINKINISKNIGKLKIISILKLGTNSLESIVLSRFPAITSVIKELSLLKKCEFSRVTGSGSACFGLFLNKKHALAGLKLIKKRFPKFWCVLSKTI